MNHQEGGQGWNNVAQDRDKWLAVVNAVMKRGVPQNFLTSRGRNGFSRITLLRVANVIILS